MIVTLFVLSTLPFVLADVPPEVFSPFVAQKSLATFHSLPSPIQYPQYTDTTSGDWLYFDPNTWTSAFFPSSLYALNTRAELCGATASNGLGTADWLDLARSASTALLSLNASAGLGHDVGFISDAFVAELAVNPNNETAKAAINGFAGMLAARFNPIVGCTRSWDTTDPTNFEVIIDNMMNLEVLFQSADLTGNDTLRDIATSHANTTIKNHIRSDGSTWHVVEYNATTGIVIEKRTAQGYSNDSTWSRGQAWGIYGFANMFNRTGNTEYLDTARRLATYFLSNLLPNETVPWDFNAPFPRPADSSAATIVINGLLLLSQQETTTEAKNQWTNAALRILNNITALAWNPSWQSLLSNGTVNEPKHNVGTGIVYGDYFFIRAGNELVTMGLASCNESQPLSIPPSTFTSSSRRLTLHMPVIF